MTLPWSGVPEMRTTPMAPMQFPPSVPQSVPLNTTYSSELGVICTAGTGLERDESGPIAAPLTGVEPATICDFCRTQVDWPSKNAAWEKSFHDRTTLSER